MTSADSPLAAWDPELRREAGHALAVWLAAVADRAKEIAHELAPSGPGPGVRVHRYEGPHDVVSKHLQFQLAFPDFQDFLSALEQGDHGAIEIAIEIASHIDPESVVPVARRLLSRSVWRELGSALGSALGAASSKEAFDLLVEHTREPYLAGGLHRIQYAGGVARAWEVYAAFGDLDQRDLDPRVRVSAVPVLVYLFRFDRARALPEIVRVLHVDAQLPHALYRAQTPECDAELIACIDRTPPGKPLSLAARLGIQCLLRQDATTALDRLGGRDRLMSPDGRARADALLECLDRDEQLAKRPHKGTPAGWLRADPRFAELCDHYRRDKQLGPRAVFLLDQLPPELRPVPQPLPKPQRAKRIPAALRRTMEGVRTELEAIVTALSARGYRFEHSDRALVPPTPAGKRAITKLKRELGPLPQVLEAFWTVVGSVDLRGHDPNARDARPVDPLVILPPELLLEDALDNATEGVPFALAFAPDALGKSGYSGGTLSVWLPAEADDPEIEGGDVRETLLAHILRSVEAGGLPGAAPR